MNIPALDRLLGALGGATFVYNNILPDSNIEPIAFCGVLKMPAPPGVYVQSGFLLFTLVINKFNNGS